jgi:hypothetical protein
MWAKACQSISMCCQLIVKTLMFNYWFWIFSISLWYAFSFFSHFFLLSSPIVLICFNPFCQSITLFVQFAVVLQDDEVNSDQLSPAPTMSNTSAAPSSSSSSSPSTLTSPSKPAYVINSELIVAEQSNITLLMDMLEVDDAELRRQTIKLLTVLLMHKAEKVQVLEYSTPMRFSSFSFKCFLL